MFQKDLYEASKKSSHEIPAKSYFLKEIYASTKLNKQQLYLKRFSGSKNQESM